MLDVIKQARTGIAQQIRRRNGENTARDVVLSKMSPPPLPEARRCADRLSVRAVVLPT